MFSPHAERRIRVVTERALPAALAADLEGSFESLVLRYQDRLYALARRLLGDPQAAQEAAQDTFVNAYRALQRYEAERIRVLALRAWLYRILMNVVRNRVRGRRLAQMPLVHEDGSTLEIGDESTRERPEEEYLRGESARALESALSAVSERYRMPLELRHVDGLPYAEIAQILGRPVGTVKAYVHRGIAELRSHVNVEELA